MSVMVEISPSDITSALSHCAYTVHASFRLAGSKVELLLEHNRNIVSNMPIIISGAESDFEHWTMHQVSQSFLVHEFILRSNLTEEEQSWGLGYIKVTAIPNCLFQSEDLCMYHDIDQGAAMAVKATEGQYQLVS